MQTEINEPTIAINLTESELITLTGAMRGQPADRDLAEILMERLDILMLTEFTAKPCPEIEGLADGYYIGVSDFLPEGARLPSRICSQDCEEVDPPISLRVAHIVFPNGKRAMNPLRLLVKHQNVSFTPCTEEEYNNLIAENAKAREASRGVGGLAGKLEAMALSGATEEQRARYVELKAKGKANCTQEERDEMVAILADITKKLADAVGEGRVSVQELVGTAEGAEAGDDQGCGDPNCRNCGCGPATADIIAAEKLLSPEDQGALARLVAYIKSGAPSTPAIEEEIKRLDGLLKAKTEEVIAARLQEVQDGSAAQPVAEEVAEPAAV